jgi:hypothetical protein
MPTHSLHHDGRRGLSLGNRWRLPADGSGDSKGYGTGGSFPSASHTSSTTAGTNGVDVAAGVIAP